MHPSYDAWCVWPSVLLGAALTCLGEFANLGSILTHSRSALRVLGPPPSMQPDLSITQGKHLVQIPWPHIALPQSCEGGQGTLPNVLLRYLFLAFPYDNPPYSGSSPPMSSDWIRGPGASKNFLLKTSLNFTMDHVQLAQPLRLLGPSSQIAPDWMS